FFSRLAIFTILKKRESPHSALLALRVPHEWFDSGAPDRLKALRQSDADAGPTKRPPVRILETGVVGSLDYKVLEADRADALFDWLKANKYQYAGDEATLDYYVKKKWFFTVMKIDTMAMKKNKDGTFSGEVTPTRFQFASEKFIYPLKITQI